MGTAESQRRNKAWENCREEKATTTAATRYYIYYYFAIQTKWYKCVTFYQFTHTAGHFALARAKLPLAAYRFACWCHTGNNNNNNSNTLRLWATTISQHQHQRLLLFCQPHALALYSDFCCLFFNFFFVFFLYFAFCFFGFLVCATISWALEDDLCYELGWRSRTRSLKLRPHQIHVQRALRPVVVVACIVSGGFLSLSLSCNLTPPLSHCLSVLLAVASLT